MIDLHVKNAAFSAIDSLMENVENKTREKSTWMKVVVCGLLMIKLKNQIPPIYITRDESLELFEMWETWKQELIKNGS